MKYKVYCNRQFLSHENAHNAQESVEKAIKNTYAFHKDLFLDRESVFVTSWGREKTYFTQDEMDTFIGALQSAEVLDTLIETKED